MEREGAYSARPAGSGLAPGDSDKRPVLSRFKQQQLPAWQPILTPLPVIATFIAVALVFIPIGAALLVASNNVVEITKRYDDICPTTNATKPCVFNLTIPAQMDPTIYVYYRLDNFYQNHRRYARSRNDDQLDGVGPEVSQFDSCDPLKFINDNGTDLQNWLVPCGLIAGSVFNDSFAFIDGNTVINVSQSGIAWKSDVDKKFSNPPNWQNSTLFPYHKTLDLNLFPGYMENERFIVWMRIAGLPSFRKLWGKIEQPLTAGSQLFVNASSIFPVASFSGRKYLVLSTVSWAGGKNNFLGIAYIVIGCVAAVIAIVLCLLHKLKPRRLGDPNYLRWK